MIDYLMTNYSKAIKALRQIENELSKYDIYLKVNSFTNMLKLTIENKNMSFKELEKITPELINILNDLKKSNALNCSNEEYITEKLYKIAYYLLKEEIKFGKDTLFNALKSDEVHTMYLDKEISLELDSLDENDVKNNNIFRKKSALDLDGINSHYLDYELLSLITGKVNSEKDAKEISKLLPLYQEIDKKLHNLDINLDLANSRKNSAKNGIKSYSKPSKYIKSLSNIFIGASVITTLFGGAFLLARKAATPDIYLHQKEITTNDTDDYINNIENISNDFGTIDFSKSNVEQDTKNKSEDTLKYKEIYDNISYIASESEFNDSKKYIYTSEPTYSFEEYLFVSEFFALLIYIFTLLLANDYSFHLIPVRLVRGIEDIIYNVRNLSNEKKYEKRYNKEKKKIVEDIKELITTYDNEIREILNYADFICEYGNDKVSDDLRNTLININKSFNSIFKLEDGTVIKDTIENMKVKKLSK